MSVSNLQMQYAMRTQLLTMEAATTGSISMSTTSSGFVRASGSFILDGFEPGMELAATGFSTGSNNANWVVDTVTALTLFVTGLTAESSSSGRTLLVGLPSGRAWENLKFTPTAGEPWMEEDFLGGPTTQVTAGTSAATLLVDPLYVVKIYVPEDTGIGGVNRYADAVLAAFKPNTSMTLTNSDVLRVRIGTGPSRGQIIRQRSGWVVVPVTVPFRLLTLNA